MQFLLKCTNVFFVDISNLLTEIAWNSWFYMYVSNLYFVWLKSHLTRKEIAIERWSFKDGNWMNFQRRCGVLRIILLLLPLVLFTYKYRQFLKTSAKVWLFSLSVALRGFHAPSDTLLRRSICLKRAEWALAWTPGVDDWMRRLDFPYTLSAPTGASPYF